MPEGCRYCNRPLEATVPEDRRHGPFCSARCRMAELGHWFEGRYVVRRKLGDVADDAAAPAPRDAGHAGPDAASSARGAVIEEPDANDINS